MSFEFGLNSPNSSDLSEQFSPEIMERALEYANLAAIPHPSERQAERISEILEEALDSEVLNFLIVEFDRALSQQLKLFDDDCLQDYKDQQALLREYLGTGMKNFPIPKEQQILDYSVPLPSNQTSSKSLDSLPSRAQFQEQENNQQALLQVLAMMLQMIGITFAITGSNGEMSIHSSQNLIGSEKTMHL